MTRTPYTEPAFEAPAPVRGRRRCWRPWFAGLVAATLAAPCPRAAPPSAPGRRPQRYAPLPASPTWTGTTADGTCAAPAPTCRSITTVRPAAPCRWRWSSARRPSRARPRGRSSSTPPGPAARVSASSVSSATTCSSRRCGASSTSSVSTRAASPAAGRSSASRPLRTPSPDPSSTTCRRPTWLTTWTCCAEPWATGARPSSATPTARWWGRRTPRCSQGTCARWSSTASSTRCPGRPGVATRPSRCPSTRGCAANRARSRRCSSSLRCGTTGATAVPSRAATRGGATSGSPSG